MTRIYITRHGETEWNKQRRFQGSKNSELTDKGILGAELLAARIEDIELDCIISSPLKRAYHTASIVKGNKNLEIIKYDGLMEINLGDFEGMSWDEIHEKSPEAISKITADPFTNRYPNGENLNEFYNRVEKAFLEIIEKCRNKRVLIVAHGGTIKCIESYIRKFKINEDWIGNVVQNCSLSCYDISDDNEIKEVFFNDIEHLKGKLAFN